MAFVFITPGGVVDTFRVVSELANISTLGEKMTNWRIGRIQRGHNTKLSLFFLAEDTCCTCMYVCTSIFFFNVCSYIPPVIDYA